MDTRIIDVAPVSDGGITLALVEFEYSRDALMGPAVFTSSWKDPKTDTWRSRQVCAVCAKGGVGIVVVRCKGRIAAGSDPDRPTEYLLVQNHEVPTDVKRFVVSNAMAMIRGKAGYGPTGFSIDEVFPTSSSQTPSVSGKEHLSSQQSVFRDNNSGLQ
jgi:hypothetical protein